MLNSSTLRSVEIRNFETEMMLYIFSIFAFTQNRPTKSQSISL